jgi:hypothetical protein
MGRSYISSSPWYLHGGNRTACFNFYEGTVSEPDNFVDLKLFRHEVSGL